MSVMERRLQLLLDQDRYAKVAEEARRSGRSVAAVIREAIDRRFDESDARTRRSDAARRLLERARAGADELPYESPAALKDAYQQDLAASVDEVGE